MKLIMTICIVLSGLFVHAQNDVAKKIATALQKGDAAAIGAFLVPSVDLTVLDDEDMYPSDQVVKKLARFFTANKPSKFEIKHEGTSKLDDHYRIGDLTTSTGIYRVTYFMIKGSAGMKLKQLRIEKFE